MLFTAAGVYNGVCIGQFLIQRNLTRNSCFRILTRKAASDSAFQLDFVRAPRDYDFLKVLMVSHLDEDCCFHDADAVGLFFRQLAEETVFFCEYEGVDDAVQFLKFFWIAEYKSAKSLTVDTPGGIQNTRAKCVDGGSFRRTPGLQQAVAHLIGLQYVAAQLRQNCSDETLARCEPSC